MSEQQKITKTMRYEIKYNKELYNLLSDIQYIVYRLKNKATSMAWDWQQFSFGYNNRFGEYPKDKDLLGKSLSADIYNQIKDEFGNFVSSYIVDVSIQEAVKKIKKDIKEILKGERTIPNYKKDGSFPIRTKQITHLTKITPKRYSCKLSLLSKEGYRERGMKTGQIDIELRTGNGANVILDRIINNEYKMCDSRIVKKKNKFYLLLAYQFTPEKVELDENKIMGIDLGFNTPATIAVSHDKYYYQFVGDGKEIRDFENQVLARKKRIQKSRKWAGDGSIGHGIKTRLKALEKINNKIANFKQTKNHNWSRYIVDEAVKMGCGTIQLEDLSGISEENTFLKRWTYYQLQQYIKYKAEEKGIKVVVIDPQYTSARCSQCGHIHINEKKEKWRPTQDKFICQNCGYQTHADVNAARNIAIKDIDKIIKKQIEVQNNHEKHILKYCDL